MKASHSWDSSYATAAEHLSTSQNTLHVLDDREENLPTPPHLPTLGYLLGKRPPNLRGKKHSSRSMSGEDSKWDDDDEHISDRDSDHSSVSSTQSDGKSQHKKRAKKKKRGPREDDVFDWQYNKLTVPQSSPPRERKGITRKLTPTPTKPTFRGHNSVIDDKLKIGSLSDSPSSLNSQKSPTTSPNRVSPSPIFDGITGYLEQQGQPKEETSVLSLPQKSRQGMVNVQRKPPNLLSKRTTPISLKDSSRKQIQRQPGTSGNQHTTGAFMADLNQAVNTSRFTQRHVNHEFTSPAGHYPSPTSSIGQVRSDSVDNLLYKWFYILIYSDMKKLLTNFSVRSTCTSPFLLR